MSKSFNTQGSSVVGPRVMPSLDAESVNLFSNYVYLIAGTIAVLATAITVVASLVMWRTSMRIADQKDREFAEFKTASNTAVSAANKAAATANERAAELSKDAEDARLQQEKLKAQLAWRVLSPEQINTLGRALSDTPGSVNLRYSDGDPEALYFAIQFSSALNKAGWQIAAGTEKFSNALVIGIAQPGPVTSNAQRLRKALSIASIPFTTSDLPPQGVSFDTSVIPDAPTLMIGSRLPKFP